MDLKSMTLQEMQEYMESIGEKKFRAKQIYEWFHKHLALSLDEMNNVPKKLKEKIEQVNENVRILYDMTFTAYQKTVPVDAVAVSGTQVIGYVSSEKADLSFGEEHIREILKNNKCKSVGVKLFREEKRFLDQLKQMNQKQSEHETTGSRKAEYICDVLRAIVL